VYPTLVAAGTEYRCYRLILKTEGRRGENTQGAGEARFPLSRSCISFIRSEPAESPARSLPRFADNLVVVGGRLSPSLSLLRGNDRPANRPRPRTSRNPSELVLSDAWYFSTGRTSGARAPGLATKLRGNRYIVVRVSVCLLHAPTA